MSNCTTWKKCVSSLIKATKKKHPHKKISLKHILKQAKVEYAKEKKNHHADSSSKGKGKTNKRRSSKSKTSKKKMTRKNRK